MATIGGLTGLSRVAGFIRDILTAAILGAGPVADAFFVALKLPNFFRRITAEGAFSVSFVPLYSAMLEKDGADKAAGFASRVMSMMLLLLLAFTGLAMIAMPLIIFGIAPGFSDDALRFDLAVELSRVTFPYLLLMSLTALLGGILNAHNRFGPFAFAPVLFNLALIAALLMHEFFETPGHALAWGVLAAGFLQLFFLIAFVLRIKIPVRPARPSIDSGMKKLFKLMGPGVIGAGVMHINLFADLIIASFLEAGAISYLYYADRLNQLPLGMVGIAVGTALLPMLSKAIAADRGDEARDLFNRALEYCFLLALPAAVALFVIPLPLIAMLFERGAFESADTSATAGVLMAYATGLPAYIAVKVFSTAHWARGDTVTPVRIAVIGTVANIILSLIFVQFIGVAGIALGTGLTGWLQLVLHRRALAGHAAAQMTPALSRSLLKIILSSALMGICLYLALTFAPFETGHLIYTIALIAAGFVIYASSILMSGVIRAKDIGAYLRGRRS